METAVIGNMIDLCAVMMLLTTVMAVATTNMKPLIGQQIGRAHV